MAGYYMSGWYRIFTSHRRVKIQPMSVISRLYYHDQPLNDAFYSILSEYNNNIDEY